MIGRVPTPKLKCIVIEEGLASNGPHIQDLISLNFEILLGAKPGDHTLLFDNFMKMNELGQIKNLSVEVNGSSPETQTQWHDHLQLNASLPDIAVKFIQHTEFYDQLAVTQRYSWVTQLEVTPENVPKLVRGGHARWKIENETFSTLKN